MRRLIDADKLKKDILDLPDCYNGFSDTFDKACIIGVIDEQPSAQPERKKGWWIDMDDHVMCSCCGATHYGADKNYCPNCGADCRGENNG